MMPARPPLSYIERTTSYYLGLGYDNPYRWAEFETVPFTRPSKLLQDMRVAIVTTAAPFQPGKGDQARARHITPQQNFISFIVCLFHQNLTCGFHISP